MVQSEPTYEKFYQTIKDYQLIENNDRIVIALSGGPDSTFLLYLLATLKEEYNLYLHIAHLNHKLRGKEADKDEEFVKNLAANFNLPITVKRENVKEFAKKNKLSIEHAARVLRYKLFEEVATRNKCSKIATAHTLSDRIETVLMRIIKGTGLDGLVGIKPIRKHNNLSIIRPLINIRKEEIINFLNKKNISYRVDSSNLDRKILRNRIRLELLPQLKSYNPNIETALLNLSEIVESEVELLNSQTEKEYKEVITRDDGKILLNLNKFRNQNLALKRRIIRRIIEEIKGDLINVQFLHVESILKWLNDSKHKLLLPNDISLRRYGDNIVFQNIKVDNSQKILYNINIGKVTNIPELGIKIEAKIVKHKSTKDSNKSAYIDYDKIKGDLKVRTRRRGDRFIPAGFKNFKKLKKFFIENKLPFYKRDNIPIIEDDEKIVWVAPYRIDERVRITPTTTCILKLVIK